MKRKRKILETDFREYTAREAGKSLTAIEIHLKQADQDSVFCNECVQKHFLEVQKFAEEGAGFFPKISRWWEEAEKWGREAARNLTLTKKNQKAFAVVAKDISAKSRAYRKRLVEILEDEIIASASRDNSAYASVMSDREAHDYFFSLSGLNEDESKDIPVEAGLGALVPHPVADALKKAKSSGCSCIDLPHGGQICFAKGLIGALNQDQIGQVCTVKNTTRKPASEPLAKQINLFRNSNAPCRLAAQKSVAKMDENDPEKTVLEFRAYTSCMRKKLQMKPSRQRSKAA